MANANVKLDVKGTDKTGAAFKSVEWRAKAAAARLRAALGGALAAASAYLSFRAIKSGIDELGKLSDVAQKTSTNVGELTQASTALTILGVNGDLDALAKAFSLMEKNTGRSGLQGFYETIDEIGRIPDVSERAKAAMSAFGRSGLEFMPLINAAHDGTDALRGVVSAMPAIPQSAADAGDEAADAMAIASNGVKSIWLQAIGAICGFFGDQYVGGIREAAARAANWLEYYAKLSVKKTMDAWKYIVELGKRTEDFLYGTFTSENKWNPIQSLKDGVRYAARYAILREEIHAEENYVWEEREARWRKDYERRMKEIDELAANYARAADEIRKNAATNGGIGGGNDNAVKTAAKIISNQLIMAESNAARRLQNIGPQYNEQIELLKKIADNTKEAADNTKKVADDAENADNPTPTDLD